MEEGERKEKEKGEGGGVMQSERLRERKERGREGGLCHHYSVNFSKLCRKKLNVIAA